VRRASHRDPILWFYTPMALPVVRNVARSLTVYDCMDELSNFMHAPPELAQLEEELMSKAEVMFTGGMSLYEAKRSRHPNVHGVPSSVDVPFFARARESLTDPADQADIPHPRIGYYGVIDERIDLELLAHIADARPDWQLVMVGPVVKIAPASLPRRQNIHYLGGKQYDELPAYVAGWQAAMMPFVLDRSTRFISPTKTPEYLAAGKPVVSTAIHDVVDPYERLSLVRIARSPEQFVAHLAAALKGERLAGDEQRDGFLARCSWDATWQRMAQLMSAALADNRTNPTELTTAMTAAE